MMAHKIRTELKWVFLASSEKNKTYAKISYLKIWDIDYKWKIANPLQDWREEGCTRAQVTEYNLLIYNKEIPASESDNTALTDTNGLLLNIMSGSDKIETYLYMYPRY